MHTLKDVKAKFPEAYSCGGELLARINNENVALATLGNGSFNLTTKGLELMGAEVVEAAAPKAPKEPKAPKAAKAPKEPEAPPAEAKDETLDDILGE